MISADEIRHIRRRLVEAENGTTEEKVFARRCYEEDVRKLLAELDEGGLQELAEKVQELEAAAAQRERNELAARERARAMAERPAPRFQTRIEFPQRAGFDAKMAAAGKDD